jgi:hypothetical protein
MRERLLEGADIYENRQELRYKRRLQKHYAVHLRNMIDTARERPKGEGLRRSASRKS